MYNSGPLSVILSGNFMIKLENDIVAPLKPKFYRRYVDDIFNRGKASTNDILFEQLNKIKLHSKKLRDIRLTCVDGIYNTTVNRKSTKLPMAWSSIVPKR